MSAALLTALAVGFFIRARRTPRAPGAGAATTAGQPPEERSLRDTVIRLPLHSDAHRALARHLLDQHRPFEALWQFREALDLNPADRDTSVSIARGLIQAGLFSLAVPTLRARLSHVPADLDPHLALAEAALATAEPERARAALRAAGPALMTSALAQQLQGDACFALGENAEAQAAYGRAIRLEAHAATGYDRVGRLALVRGAWEAAKGSFAAARKREPNGVGHAYRLGQAYWGAGQPDEAVGLWAAIAASVPDYAPAHLALGKAYRQQRSMQLAVEHLAAAAQANPSLVEAQLELAAVMEAMGRPSSALYQRGLYYLQTDRPQLALACYRRMAAVNPASATAPLMASFCRMQLKQYREAAMEAERALRDHPEDPALRQRLAQLHFLTGNTGLGEKLCREWLEESPTAAEPHRLLGHAAFNAGHYDEAVRQYEQAVALDPTSADSFLEMGKALAATGDAGSLARAVTALRRATALAPRRADAFEALGEALQRQGSLVEARDQLLRALDRDPTLVGAASSLIPIATSLRRPTATRLFTGIVHRLQSRQRESESLWREVGRESRDAIAHERLARFLTGTGDLRRAVYQWEQVMELTPTHPVAPARLRMLRRLLLLREP